MKMVAAAKLRKAQDGIIQLRPYATKLDSIFSNLHTALQGEYSNPYAEEREVKHVTLVVITSDRGLCGAFNSNILKAAWAKISTEYADYLASGNLQVLCIGKKSLEFFKRRQVPVIEQYAELFGNLQFTKVKEAAEYLSETFKNGQTDKVELFYNEFKNVATQIQKAEVFLPMKATASDSPASATNADYIFEPNKEDILNSLIPKTLNIKLYKAVRESYAGEMGARMTAMDKATENAGELLKQLKLVYNRSRQAAITKEILEIVGGAEALNN